MKFYIRPKKKGEVLSALKELGESFLRDVEEGRNPSVEVPVRTLRNIKFDAKERKIFLGLVGLLHFQKN
jgi:DNA topoisomerase VI subunit A